METVIKENELFFMQRTIEIANQNIVIPYAAIIVYDDNEIMSFSVNHASDNPIMHAELSAINYLFSKGFNGNKEKLSLYSTAEPCPMCTSAIYWAMIPKIVYGTSIPFLNQLYGRQITIRARAVLNHAPSFFKWILCEKVMELECNALFMKSKDIRKT